MMLNKKAKEEKIMLMAMEFSNFAIALKYLVNEEEWRKISESAIKGITRSVENKGDYTDMIANAEIEINNAIESDIEPIRYPELLRRFLKLEKDVALIMRKLERK